MTQGNIFHSISSHPLLININVALNPAFAQYDPIGVPSAETIYRYNLQSAADVEETLKLREAESVLLSSIFTFPVKSSLVKT